MSKKITALYERTAAPNHEEIHRQKANLEAYALDNGFHNLRHFTDCGYSGFNDMRPGFSTLMAEIDAGHVGIVIVRDATRFSRDFMATMKLTKELQDLGVRIIMLTEKIDLLPPHIHDDENGLDYTLHGDYYFPDAFNVKPDEPIHLGKWALMRHLYLKEHRPGLYTELILSGKLDKHLAEIDESATNRHQLLVRQMKEAEHVTEALKAADQLEWVQRMNAIAHTADELIMDELIYQ